MHNAREEKGGAEPAQVVLRRRLRCSSRPSRENAGNGCDGCCCNPPCRPITGIAPFLVVFFVWGP